MCVGVCVVHDTVQMFLQPVVRVRASDSHLCHVRARFAIELALSYAVNRRPVLNQRHTHTA